MLPIRFSMVLTAADDNGIAEAQQTAGAGLLDLDGVLVAGGQADLGIQRKIGVSSTGNLSAITFTVRGYDGQNREIEEELAGPNNNTVSTILDFMIVTEVEVSAAVGTDVIVGTTEVGASSPIPLNLNISPFSVSLSLLIDTGDTVDASMEYTLDDVYGGVGPFSWFPLLNMSNVTANTTDTLVAPATAVRTVINSGTDEVDTVVAQAGI